MTGPVTVRRGTAPLILAIPHAGTDLPGELVERLVSPWLARKDADWWLPELYAFAAADPDATIVATAISRTAIDVNRDPSGQSLYPGQATTGLCPVTTFDGEPLYRDGHEPDPAEIAARRAGWFDPYHAALAGEVARLRAIHPHIVLYDCHSIRSRIPRLFAGELPQFNIGTDNGTTCDPALRATIADRCAASGDSHVVDGRFRGGWTTRHYARPAEGIHTVQMELATRGYMVEPGAVSPANWPAPLDTARADRVRVTLRAVLNACLDFARKTQ